MILLYLVGSVTANTGRHLLIILGFLLFISVTALGFLAKPLVLAALVRLLALSLVELLQCCALIGRELLSVEIFSCSERPLVLLRQPSYAIENQLQSPLKLSAMERKINDKGYFACFSLVLYGIRLMMVEGGHALEVSIIGC